MYILKMNILSYKEMKTKYSTKKYAISLCIQGLIGDNLGHPETCLPCDPSLGSVFHFLAHTCLCLPDFYL